jgi:transcription antitermination factor NusA-like protein
MLLVVWVRYTLMTAVIINDIDAHTPEKPDRDIQRKIDDYCTQLLTMVEEFSLESIMKDDSSETLRYLVADHVMTIYSFIIGIRRLVRQPDSHDKVDMVTVSAARKVVQFTIEFSIDSAPAKQAQSVCIQ